MAEGKFITVINCMDGRMQLPVNEFLRQKYNADFVDTITEPGPIKILSENTNKPIVESIKHRVSISVEKHGSKVIGVVGHFDCAGNPVDKAKQLEQLDDSARLIESWNPYLEIVKLWIGENRKVQIVERHRLES